MRIPRHDYSSRYKTAVSGELTAIFAQQSDGLAVWSTTGQVKKSSDDMVRDIYTSVTSNSILATAAANRAHSAKCNAKLRAELSSLQKSNTEMENRIEGDIDLRKAFDRVGSEFAETELRRSNEVRHRNPNLSPQGYA